MMYYYTPLPLKPANNNNNNNNKNKNKQASKQASKIMGGHNHQSVEGSENLFGLCRVEMVNAGELFLIRCLLTLKWGQHVRDTLVGQVGQHVVVCQAEQCILFCLHVPLPAADTQTDNKFTHFAHFGRNILI